MRDFVGLLQIDTFTQGINNWEGERTAVLDE